MIVNKREPVGGRTSKTEVPKKHNVITFLSLKAPRYQMIAAFREPAESRSQIVHIIKSGFSKVLLKWAK